MQFSIQINQKRVVDLNYDLDLKDCAILEWLFYYCNSKSQYIKRDENNYSMVMLKDLIEALPLLKITTEDAMSRRLSDLDQKGFIKRTVKNVNEKNRRLFVIPTLKVETLFTNTHDYEVKDQKPAPLNNQALGGGSKTLTVGDQKSDYSSYDYSNLSLSQQQNPEIQNPDKNLDQNSAPQAAWKSEILDHPMFGKSQAMEFANLDQSEIDYTLDMYQSSLKNGVQPYFTQAVSWLKNKSLDKKRAEKITASPPPKNYGNHKPKPEDFSLKHPPDYYKQDIEYV